MAKTPDLAVFGTAKQVPTASTRRSMSMMQGPFLILTLGLRIKKDRGIHLRSILTVLNTYLTTYC